MITMVSVCVYICVCMFPFFQHLNQLTSSYEIWYEYYGIGGPGIILQHLM